MSEQELFNSIDEGILVFQEKVGTPMKLNKKAKSDWLIYNWRQLVWSNNGLQYLIEIFPKHKNDSVSSWILYAAVWYDSDDKRYYLNKSFASEKPLEFIAQNISNLLFSSYDYIINIPREEIPFAVSI